MINILFLYILTKFIPQINEIKKKKLNKKKKKLGTIKKLMPNYQSYVLH